MGQGSKTLAGCRAAEALPVGDLCAAAQRSMRLSRIREDSPKQLAQPQKDSPATPTPKQSKRNATVMVCVPFIHFPVLPKPPSRSASTVSSSASPWGRNTPWQKRSPFWMVTAWLSTVQGLWPLARRTMMCPSLAAWK